MTTNLIGPPPKPYNHRSLIATPSSRKKVETIHKGTSYKNRGNHYSGSISAQDRSSLIVPGFASGEKEDQSVGHLLSPENYPWARKFDPIVCLYIGRRGQGKTLTMTSVANFFKDAYAATGSNFTVATNYWCSFAYLYHPHLVPMLTQFPSWAYEMHVCIDELGAYLPGGARSNSRFNLDFSVMMQQIRKRNIELSATVQFPQWIDSKLLVQIDLLIECEQMMGGRAVKCYIHDTWGQWTGRNFRKPFPPYKEESDWQKILWNTQLTWPKYFTGEYQAAYWSEYREEMIAEQLRANNLVSEEEMEKSQEQATPNPTPQQLYSSSNPETEFLTRLPTRFNPRVYLEDVKKILPDINTRVKFLEYLESKGFAVERGGGRDFAEKTGEWRLK